MSGTLRLRDLDNRGDNGEPFEFTGTAQKVIGYLDGPLRGDLVSDERHAEVDEAVAAIRADDLDQANQILNPMAIYLTPADQATPR